MDATLGARLRRQREQQNVTLSAIAEKTKINPTLLEGLERDDVSRWPSGIFRRAYIRSYAQAIGLDPEVIVREFVDRHPDPNEETQCVVPNVVAESGARPPTRLGLLVSRVRSLCMPRPTAIGPVHTEEERSGLTEVVALPVNPQEVARGEVRNEMAEPRFEPAAVRVAARRRDAQPATPPRSRSGGMTTAARGEPVTLERKLTSIARLCTVLSCCRNQHEVARVLEDAARILDAKGVILWASDPLRITLYPVLAHGYSEDVLARVPAVRRNSDNAIAAAFRAAQVRIVTGSGQGTGAFVTPLVTPSGCVGVLALEFARGGESRTSVRALAMILSAQLSTLIGEATFVHAVSA
jgi:hypothetical protein